MDFLAFDRHETHRRSHCSFTYRFRVGRVVFLTFDEGLQISRRDQPNLVAQFSNFTRSVVSATPRFHRHHAREQPIEKLQYLRTPQSLSNNCMARAVHTMNLKNILRQIESDCSNF